MWSVQEIEAIPVELDFSSSGQGRRSVTAIEASGVRLFNAIELVDVEATATQVEVCDCCGISRCSPGGWISFRRIGDRVVWIPAWEEMEKGGWEWYEYRPPSFMESKGAPVFSAAAWGQLRGLYSGLPACDDLPSIDSRETARLCQWSAPGRLLGEYPLEPRVRRELLVAVTEGNLAAEADDVDACLEEHFAAIRPMALLSGDVDIKPVQFWLDLPGTPDWTAFGHTAGSTCFLIDGNVAVIPDG